MAPPFIKFARYWLPTILWGSGMLVLSSLPIKTTSVGTEFFLFMLLKKLTHVAEYGVFWCLLYRTFYYGGARKRKQAFLYAILIVTVWGTIDEYHQGLVPGSGGTPHIHDVLIDICGGVVACLLVWKLLPKLPTKLKKVAMMLEVA